MREYTDNERRNLAFAQMMFIGTTCPGCGHVWNEQDDLLYSRTRASKTPEAWHDECIRKVHPELFEAENQDK
jgi:hypothetical protein